MRVDPESPPTAEALPLSPRVGSGSESRSIVVTAPAGAKEGDVLEVGGRRITVPAGVNPGDSFVVAEQAPVIATPVESRDEELAVSLQRIELAQLAASPVVVGVGAYGAGRPHLSLAEQKLLNYKWSIKCFALIDLFGTLLLTVYGSWGLLAILYVIGPLFGYWGTRNLELRYISAYLSICVLKMLYVTFLVVLGSILAVFVLVTQIWVTNVVYKFWRLLGSISPSRLNQLNDPSYNIRLHFLYY